MSRSSKSTDLLGFVEGLLDLFEQSQTRHDYREHITRDHVLPLDYFRRIRPLINPLNQDGEGAIFADVTPRDLDCQTWDVSTIALTQPDEFDDRDKPHYTMRRYRRVSLKEMRGRGKLFSEYICEHGIALLFPDTCDYM